MTKRPRQQQPQQDLANTTVIENVAQTRRLADTSLSHNSQQESKSQQQTCRADGKSEQVQPTPEALVEEDRPTNNTSNSQVSSQQIIVYIYM